MFDNAVAKSRQDRMKTSPQLTLIELIMKLEAVQNRSLAVFYDDTNRRPTGLGSWRGVYAELSMGYTETENEPCLQTVESLLLELKAAIGKEYTGWKGGHFIMGKTTPIWVANQGDCSGWIKNKEEDWNEQMGIVDVAETEERVILITKVIKD